MKIQNMSFVKLVALCAALTTGWSGALFAQSTEVYELSIPAQDLGSAIIAYGVQTGNDVLFRESDIAGTQAGDVQGTYTAEQAIELLLADSDVPHAVNADGTLIVGSTAVAQVESMEDAEAGPDTAETGDGEVEPATESEQPISLEDLLDRDVIEEQRTEAKELRGLIDTIVVTGTRNVAVHRFEDDAQPYVVFDAEDIRDSAATNLNEFFRTRLPQNTSGGTTQQFSNSLGEIGNTSSIDLRGLGPGQTLILVNGRRAPRVSAAITDSSNGGFNFQQADINGIPISAIERIEVLPATASGIYGGGATGGVINIITSRNFSGGELQVLYGDTFEQDFHEFRLDGSYGFTLEDGRTSVLLTGSYADSGELLAGERDFGEDSLNLLLANSPDDFVDQFIPPLGATPNIKSGFGNLVLDDGTDLGSNITHVPVGYTGVLSDGGQGLISNAGTFNTNPAQDLNGALKLIRQAPTVYSIGASVSRDFTDNLELFVDAFYSSNEGQRLVVTTTPRIFMPGDAPGNPFQGPVSVNYPVPGVSFETDVTQETESIVGGATYKLPADWILTMDYHWSRARTEQNGTSPGFDNFGLNGVNAAIDAGTLDIFSDTSTFPLDLSPYALVSPNNIIGPRDSVARNFALRASGPVFDLPAGSVHVSTLVESRDEILESYYLDRYAFGSGIPGTLSTSYVPEREQETDSAYLEFLIPIVSEATGLSFVRALDLQISGRYDDYTTESPAAFVDFPVDSRGDIPVDPIETDRNEFDSFNYTLGLRYEISEDLLFRASFGTGFLPPSVGQIFQESDDDFFIAGSDPKRNGEAIFTRGNVLFGGNPDLVPEESESWSVGIRLTPGFLEGFMLSLDYSVIEKTDEILFADNQLILDNEDSLPGRVQRAELTQADIDAGFDVGAVTGIDRSLVNFANTKTEALDIQFDQNIDTDSIGSFRLYAVATHMYGVEQQLTETSEAVDRVGFDNGPLGWRANFGLTWYDYGESWIVGWNAQHYDEYLVYGAESTDFIIEQTVARQGSDTIPSETYHDLFVKYRPGGSDAVSGSLLDGLELQLGIQNVFDETPAAIAGFAPSDGRFSVYGDNRMRRFTLSLRKAF